MSGKNSVLNRCTGLSVDINHVDYHISFDKNWFSRVEIGDSFIPNLDSAYIFPTEACDVYSIVKLNDCQFFLLNITLQL
jgi:hypothetical protein